MPITEFTSSSPATKRPLNPNDLVFASTPSSGRDEGYGSFQSSMGGTPSTDQASQLSPDSTDQASRQAWRYSPEFLASVQTAMRIFQQQQQQQPQAAPELPKFDFASSSRLPMFGNQQFVCDSEMIIQRLLAQLRSNMLRMVDNSLAQIECSLRNQGLDRESLLSYLSQASRLSEPTGGNNMSGSGQAQAQRFLPTFPKDHMPAAGTPLRAAGVAKRMCQRDLTFDDASSISDAFSNADESTGGSRLGDRMAINMSMNSILTTAHLRKAKLMFLFVRYPNSAMLKTYFPSVKFNRGNTAQLIKWFSNFREFLYINVEKYVRQLISEGVTDENAIPSLDTQHELTRVLLMHYNRGRDIETPMEFFEVVQRTVTEFFRAIRAGEDVKASWKKPIYKIISQMDQVIPDYFKQ